MESLLAEQVEFQTPSKSYGLYQNFIVHGLVSTLLLPGPWKVQQFECVVENSSAAVCDVTRRFVENGYLSKSKWRVWSENGRITKINYDDGLADKTNG